MIRVVLDTNVVVSAFLTPDGPESQILRLTLSGSITGYVSDPILAEYATVLNRPKFKRPPELVNALMSSFGEHYRQVHPLRRITASPHEPDNRFLECADAARADFLVTGDKRHFPKQWKNTRIVNARELLAIFGASFVS